MSPSPIAKKMHSKGSGGRWINKGGIEPPLLMGIEPLHKNRVAIFGEGFLISPEPLPNTKGHPCGCPFVFVSNLKF